MERKHPGGQTGAQRIPSTAYGSAPSVRPQDVANALLIQAPSNVLPALRRLLKRQLAAAILAGDGVAITRLRQRLDSC